MEPRNLVSVLLAFLLLACGADDPGSRAADAEARIAAPTSLEARKQLESLGYVTLVPVEQGQEETEGVVVYDPAAASPGLNLFNSREKAVAQLVTLDGREVHRWASDVRGTDFVWFLENLPDHVPRYLHGWNHIGLGSGGDLLVIGAHHMLARLDWNSKVRWKLDLSAHHDFAVADDGDIYVLSDALRSTQLDGQPITFQDNQVTVVSSAGELRRTISLYDAFDTQELSQRLKERLRAVRPAQKKQLAIFRARARDGDAQDREIYRLYGSAIRGGIASETGVKNILLHGRQEDIFHSNSIQILERDNPGLWRKGDLLISIRMLDSVAVIDHETGHIVWMWGEGVLEEQHHATWLDDGRVLIFDNGTRRGYSRILKVDPRSREIVWQYEGDPPSSFYSHIRGGVQALPNGNVLIAETNKGRAFEVTAQGEIVWEYYNESLYLEREGRKRGAIYRMTRIDPSRLGGLLSSSASGAEH